ncbi:MAG: hypothetical protein H8D80_01415 [Proteobacteria bacterium]|nr:hypothetical protein [Pseudomonadota bacterium]
MFKFTQQESASPFSSAVSITNNNTTNTLSRAVYVGVAGNYEFYINGGWVHFKAIPAGTVLHITAKGARDQSDSSAPSSGEIVFLR